MVNAETWQALAEYEEMLGPQVEAIIYDWSIRRWRRCKMQPLRTRRDRVTPANPDEMIEQVEGKGSEGGAWRAEVVRKAKEAAGQRHAELQARITGYLRAHGPSRMRVIAEQLELQLTTVQGHMMKRKGAVYTMRKVGQSVHWGLVGVHDE